MEWIEVRIPIQFRKGDRWEDGYMVMALTGVGLTGDSARFYDAFGDSDGVRLPNHPMNTGQGWEEAQGEWSILGNKAICSGDAGDGQNVAESDAGKADVTYTVICTIAASASAGVIANFESNTDYWVVVCSTQSNVWVLYERTGGNFTQRDSLSETISAGQAYTLKVITSGDGITVYVDGVQKLQYTGSPRAHKTGTRFGLYEFHSNVATAFDDARAE